MQKNESATFGPPRPFYRTNGSGKPFAGAVIVAETGADLSKQEIASNSLHIVPMHVCMGDDNLDDGAIPTQSVFEYYARTKKLPTTAATSPMEFRDLFDRLRALYPNRYIVYLAYSAVTTACW